ncbi:MAG: hypothetical protein SCK57_12135 [Bacillota bacterium]|nr:hypothetical protein [Bacillota bacterium]MDW7678402.1 hypothetical protein [Bacillota bacterium]
MQIESILIFVAFVIISSLANKRKQAQQQQRQQRKQQTDQRPQQSRQQPPNQQQKSSSTAQRPMKRTLQDLFREMQQEMQEEYHRTREQAKKTPAEEAKPFAPKSNGNVAASQMLQQTAKKLPAEPTKTQKKKSPIYTDEIKDKPNGIDIDLTDENILNGIIFSEILGKPKSLRS